MSIGPLGGDRVGSMRDDLGTIHRVSPFGVDQFELARRVCLGWLFRHRNDELGFVPLGEFA